MVEQTLQTWFLKRSGAAQRTEWDQRDLTPERRYHVAEESQNSGTNSTCTWKYRLLWPWGASCTATHWEDTTQRVTSYKWQVQKEYSLTAECALWLYLCTFGGVSAIVLYIADRLRKIESICKWLRFSQKVDSFSYSQLSRILRKLRSRPRICPRRGA